MPETPDSKPLDQGSVEHLASDLMQVVNFHLRTPPPSPERVFEALNALAITVVYLLQGTGRDKRASDFFATAFNDQWQQEIQVDADDKAAN